MEVSGQLQVPAALPLGNVSPLPLLWMSLRTGMRMIYYPCRESNTGVPVHMPSLCRLSYFGCNIINRNLLLWHIDCFAGQRSRNKQRNNGRRYYVMLTTYTHATIEELCFLRGPCRSYISGASWFVSEWVRELLRFSSCEPLPLKAASRETRIVLEPTGRGKPLPGND
jgi:hypothetical protein